MAQKDYENLMAASQKTRATNAESITEKESASAEWSEKIENAKTESASTTEALAKLKEYIAGLHSSCDFLVENYDPRRRDPFLFFKMKSIAMLHPLVQAHYGCARTP